MDELTNRIQNAFTRRTFLQKSSTGLGALVMALFCAWHFGRVRARG